MTRESLLETVRQVARTPAGLFRIHREHPGLYARARRMFGSWSQAVRSAGVDYERMIELARRRSRETLRERRKTSAAGGLASPGHEPDTAF